jgi:hypothetical protein
MVGGLLEINLILTNLMLFYLVVHCYQFKGQVPVMTESLKSYGMELNDNANNALSILEDMIELLEENPSGGNIINTPNPATGESIMNMLTNQFMANLISPNSHGTQEIPTQDEEKTND